jgi:putative ABC transport system permease protein
MLKHNIKLFLRNIKKNKGTFLINVLGLGVGVTSFVVLCLYVQNDLTYNRFHKNLSDIYRVREGEGIQTKGLLLPQMLQEIPEVENGTRIFDWGGNRLSHGNEAFFENMHYVDQGFFKVFSFPFAEGAAHERNLEKFGAVISRKMAEKYFGQEPALGKQLQVDFSDQYLTVNGVIDIPTNSSIQFDIIASYKTGETINPWMKEIHDWYNTFSNTYVLLKKGSKPQDLQHKLERIVTENFLPVGQNTTKLNLLPFKDYHAVEESNQTLIVILAIIALGIIGIAIVNFINLNITHAITRIREVGIKKVHGATKRTLFFQIMTESCATSFVALVLGIVLIILLLPIFNGLFGTQLRFDPFQNRLLAIILFVIWGLVSLLSGLIPSLFWTKGLTVQSLKDTTFSGNRASASRYALIVVQFVIAIVLIAGTFLVRKQVNAMIEKDPKFDGENVIVVELDYWQYEDQEKAYQNFYRIAKEMETGPYVESISFSQNVPGTYNENYNTFYPEGKSKEEAIGLRKAYVGEDYFRTLGIELWSGNDFDPALASLEEGVVLNRKAMETLGYQEAKGQVLYESSETGTAYRVVGAIEDFSYQGVQREVQPLVHFIRDKKNLADWGAFLLIKTKPGASIQTLETLKDQWEEMGPSSNLNYFFANEKLNEHYKEYVKIETLVAWFSILAGLLSCMGLFALASHSMARRKKEIGIRKVNGATIGQILTLLNKDFAKWVGLAFVIAVPISWYAMNQWLEGFAYRTSISWWIFALAGITALFIALLTVSWQSFRAAAANPVDSLRSE